MDRRSENEIIFRTDDVTKVYDTGEVKVYALAGVDLELYASELTVLLGPSGSGKSALALGLMAVALDLRPFRALTLVRARSPPSASGAAAASVAAEVEGGAADKAAFP